jgi:hypothetical protein
MDSLKIEIRDFNFQGIAFEHVCSLLELALEDAYFWAMHAGAEIDLSVRRGGRHYGFEFKVSEKPAVTHSMTIATADLGLEKIFVVYLEEVSFPLHEGIEAFGYSQFRASPPRLTLVREWRSRPLAIGNPRYSFSDSKWTQRRAEMAPSGPLTAWGSKACKAQRTGRWPASEFEVQPRKLSPPWLTAKNPF